MALAIIAVNALRPGRHGVAVTGDVPTGLFSSGSRRRAGARPVRCSLGALSVVFVGYSESLAAARAMARKHGYEIDTNQELIAQGMACGAAGLVGGFAVDGSLSKTSVADTAGQRSQMASLINAGFVLLTMLFLASLFEDLPSATLGAVVIDAMLGLITFVELKRYYRVNRADWVFFMGAGLGILCFGIIQGIVIGVVLSLLLLIARSSRTSVRELGRSPTTGTYHEASVTRVWRPSPGCSSSASTGRSSSPTPTASAPPSRTWRGTSGTPTGGGGRRRVDLPDRHRWGRHPQPGRGGTEAQGTSLMLAAVHPPVLELWQRGGVIDAIGADAVFETVHEAVCAVNERIRVTADAAHPTRRLSDGPRGAARRAGWGGAALGRQGFTRFGRCACRLSDRRSEEHLPGARRESLATDLRSSRIGRADGSQNAPPAFELLESKLRPPHERTGTVSRAKVIGQLESARETPIVVVSAGPGWGKTTLLAQWASVSQRPFAWLSIDERDNDPIVLLTYVAVALDRVSPLDPTCVRRARVTRCVGRGDGRPAPGRGSCGDGPAAGRRPGRRAPAREPGRLGRRGGAGATRPGGLAADALRARRAGAAPGSASRPRPDAGDRARRPPYDRDRGSPAPPCRRRGPVRGPRRRAHPTDRGLVGRPLSRGAVDPGAGDQGQGRGDVLGERPPRLRLPGVGGAGALLPRRASVPDADRRARADVRAALRRGPRGERLLGDAGVAGPLQPVRGGARRPWGLVPIPPPLPGPPPVAAGPRRARPGVGAPGARGRLVRGEPAARGGHRVRAGGRRRRPSGATGRALHHARLPERPCRNRRTLARLAGGAWRARTQRSGRRARRAGHGDLGSAGRGGASGRGGRTRDVRGHPVRRQPVDRRVAGPPARPALSSRGDEDARRCGARDPNA